MQINLDRHLKSNVRLIEVYKYYFYVFNVRNIYKIDFVFWTGKGFLYFIKKYICIIWSLKIFLKIYTLNLYASFSFLLHIHNKSVFTAHNICFSCGDLENKKKCIALYWIFKNFSDTLFIVHITKTISKE